MLLKKILVLPIFVFGVIAFANLVTGNMFLFIVWSLVTLLTFLIVYPLLTNKEDRVVPVFQVFFSLLALIIFTAVIAILDFKNIGTYSTTESIVFGTLFGVGVIASIMIIKGRGSDD